MECNKLIILGVRGVPASHGGFETFAENLSVFLVSHGWKVTVYCQEEGVGDAYNSEWNGVDRVHIPVKSKGAIGTIVFDWKSIVHSLAADGVVLTLGYNTAAFNVFYRIKGKINLINMDGIEWKRDKWKWYERVWLYLNERLACLIGHHLIADHPEIKHHLVTRVASEKVTMIPYGAREVLGANIEELKKYDLDAGEYFIVIARPEPENSILEIVRAFSSRQRNKKLVLLGHYNDKNDYQKSVISSAGSEVVFLGAIYDHSDLDALRYYSACYIHGHTVGGTNPSLIEALGAGQPVLANNNKFNRWVAGAGAIYFDDEADLSKKLDYILSDGLILSRMSRDSRVKFKENFTWSAVLEQYKQLLATWV